MKVEWNPKTHEVFIEGRAVERVAVYFVKGNEAPVAEWKEGPASHSVPCEISISASVKEREKAVEPPSAPSAPARPVNAPEE